MQNPEALTRYRSGSLGEFAWLTGSFALVFVFLNLIGFVDRIFLARHSLESLEICASAASLLVVFQVFFMRMAHTTQVFVGGHLGANRPELVGPCIWQSIWFSLFSIIAAVPLGWFIAPWFFSGMPIERLGLSYFYTLLWANFLFPLGTSLSSFYLSRGRVKIVLASTIGCFIVHIGLDAAMIFGVKGYWPSWGAIGSAWSLAIVQFGFCAFLFADFLRKDNRRIYRTGDWKPDWNSFGYLLKLGIPRSVSALVNMATIAAITQIMIVKGGEYAAVMAFGSSILVLTQSLAAGFMQAGSCAGAYAIGTKSQPLFWQVYRSGCLLIVLYGALLSLPCIFFPNILIALFFKHPPSPILYELLRYSCICLWINILLQGWAALVSGMLIAAREAFFHMVLNLTLGWMLFYFPTYFSIQLVHCPPYTFFLCVALGNLGIGWGYRMRLRRERWRTA